MRMISYKICTGCALILLIATAQAADTDASAPYVPKLDTKVPARYSNAVLTERQMTGAGLRAPAPGNRWVQMGDKYVEMRSSDGTVQSVEAAVK
jgi:hypothetical protein